MTRVLLAVTLLCLAEASRAASPSVAVKTEPARQGALPDLVEAFGSAAPALDGGTTISLQQEGQIAAIAVTPGEAVHSGQRLLDFGESATAASAYQQAQSALTLARQQRANTAQLLRQQLATRDQLAQADNALADAQAALEALKREGAGNPVRSLTAPFDGIVTAIPVAQGQRVQPATPLMTLTRMDGLVVTVGIEPGDRGKVRPNQQAALHPLWGGPDLSGTVLRVDQVLNPKTRLIDADVAVPAGTVVSGEAFRVELTVGQLTGWLVPHDAVLIDDKGAFLFQTQGGKAVRVSVSVEATRGGTDVVTGPVHADLPIVVQGNYQLSDGMEVRAEGNQEAQR